MYNKGINKYINDNFEVKNREIFIKVKKDNKVKLELVNTLNL